MAARQQAARLLYARLLASSSASRSAASSCTAAAASTSSAAPAPAAAHALVRAAAAATPATNLRAFSAASSLPPHTILGMPALSPTMTTGSVAKWHVKEGQAVQPGDVLADIETDKATLAFENQEEGVVARILVPDGARDVPVGQPVAVMVEDAADVAAFKDYSAGGAAPAADAPAAAAAALTAAARSAAAASSSSAPSHQQQQHHNPRLGPAVRFALHEAGLEAGDVPSASGPNGILTKGDVLAAVAAGVKHSGGGGGAAAAPPAASPAPPKAAAAAAAPAAPKPAAAAPKPPPPPAAAAATTTATHTDVPNSQVRRVIATRLLESKRTSPACYASADVDLSAVSALRKELAAAGVKVSLNDIVVRAAALALRAAPQANARWDAQSQSVVPQASVDVAIAVATEGGLITPIVKDADAKSLKQVASEVRDLAGRARSNALKPEEFMGGTFTVSNLGMFGLDSFSAIINPPQGAILAVGGAREEVRLVPGEAGEPPALEARPAMTATLSCDERAVDASAAAAFLEAFSGFMARPATLLM